MQQYRLKRTYATVAFVAGQPATVDLPRAYDYESVHMRLYGTLNITTAATSVRAEAPVQLIPRVELIADGRNTLVSAPFWFTTLAKYDRPSMLEQGARVTTPPTGTAIAAYAIEANGVIDMATMDGERPKDSNFRTDGLQLFQLRFTFGQATDILVGGAANMTNTFVEVSTVELVELPDTATGNRTTPSLLKKISFQEVSIPTNNSNQEVRLPAGNLIKSLVVRTEGATTAGEPSTTILNRMIAFTGSDVRFNLTSGAIRGQNNNDYGQLAAGYYVADLTRNGSQSARLTELWDVTRQAEPKISLDVQGGANNKAQVVITEYLTSA